MNLKKINFKQPKYIIPLIALIPSILIVTQVSGLFIGDRAKVAQELSTELGESSEKIISKNEAYEIYFEKGENRSMLDGLDEENDSLNTYSENLSEYQKRRIDSLEFERTKQLRQEEIRRHNYYAQKQDEQDFQRSKDIIRMLNSEISGTASSNNVMQSQAYQKEEEPYDPVKVMRQQMLVMDSIEKVRDPEYQAQLKAEEKLKKNKDKMKAFLNSSLSVSKVGLSPHFNSVSVEYESNFIKAVLDETNKGYLGSRIRFRILEDIAVGTNIIPKGSILYGQITGFTMQRVNLNILSVLSRGKIYPVNLAIYDVDGMKGLYVPASMFREMMREFGVNSVQGQNLEMDNMNFFASMGSKFFTSASQSMANIIQKNKAKLKYNSFIYLVDEKETGNSNPY
ncbi:conjugative transposon protein TraM [Cruoricaptor ignavus]|uniref:Conjugative transposon protein TraM n=1 Tax=Cruoricaptor ignavus TaxID=1118202 RepID=A0A7M1T4D6_9FLAO|nr:conjugative transposon protein TraM [Cruoricaptor ignavus]QOR74611.1 conjugative transposon protein TraM [Cruoricaptor ignavus]